MKLHTGMTANFATGKGRRWLNIIISQYRSTVLQLNKSIRFFRLISDVHPFHR